METNWDPEAMYGGPIILWKVDIGTGYSNVAIKGNRLYTTEIKGVYSLNAEKGEAIWRYVFERPIDFHSTPIIEGEYVYGLSRYGKLFCLKANNGKLRWQKDLVSEYNVVESYWDFGGSTVIEGDLIAGYIIDEKYGGKVRTVRGFVSEFRGLSSTAKQKEVTTGFSGVYLHDLVKDDDIDITFVEKLLLAMKDASKAPKPSQLGNNRKRAFNKI